MGNINKDVCIALNSQIFEKEKEKINLDLEILELEFKLKNMESLHMSHIIGEFDDRGRAVYGNAESRRAQLDFMLSKSDDFIMTRATSINKTKASKILGAEIDLFKRKLQILEMI